MFRGPNLIDFDHVSEAMLNSDADKVANNYAAGMFSVKQIINP